MTAFAGDSTGHSRRLFLRFARADRCTHRDERAKFLMREANFSIGSAGTQSAADRVEQAITTSRMNPLSFLGLTLAASAVTHCSVRFLEPERASLLKAVALNALLVIGANFAHWSGARPDPVVEWIVYVVVTAACVRSLYRLKPFNSVTVGACYVAGSYVLAQVAASRMSSFIS
jgi:hypothetical protein